MRFHNHDENQIVVHLLVELFARSAEEATEVLEAVARGKQVTATIGFAVDEGRAYKLVGRERELERHGRRVVVQCRLRLAS